MPSPILHPTSVVDGVAPGATYRIEGELTPVLHVALDGAVPIYFEHHVVMWKQPQIEVSIKKLSGAFKRVVAGMPVFMTQATGAGEIAFSRDAPGHVFALPLGPRESVIVREHQFLAATDTVGFTFNRVQGIGSMLFGAQGFFVDTFTADSNGGTVWLHAHGNAFDLDLAPGEIIDVEPSSWVYRSHSVGYEQKVFGLKTGILAGGGNLVFNRFTGPGRVGLQSGFAELLGAGSGTVGKAAKVGIGAGILGAVLGGD